MGDAKHLWGTDEPGGKAEGGPIAPSIFQHMAEFEEALRSSFLPDDSSVGEVSSLPCSSI